MPTMLTRVLPPLVALLLLLASCAPRQASVKGGLSPAAAGSRSAVDPNLACVLTGSSSIASMDRCPDEKEDIVCSWGFGVRFAPDLPAYAEIIPRRGATEVKTRLTFPVGPHKLGVQAEVRGHLVTLRGQIMDNDRYVFPRKPLRLSDAVFALANTRLLWFEGSPGQLLVGVRRVSSFQPVTRQRVKAACGELAIEATYVDDEANRVRKMAGLGPVKRKVALHSKKRIPLYSTAEKKLQGTIYIDKAVPDEVAVIKESKDRSLVFVLFHYYALYGWIPNEGIDEAAKDTESLGGIYGAGGGVLLEGGSCSSDKTLYVKFRGRQRAVGTMHKDKHFFVLGKSSRWTRIRLEQPYWFKMAKGYFMYLETAALDDCQPGS